MLVITLIAEVLPDRVDVSHRYVLYPCYLAGGDTSPILFNDPSGFLLIQSQFPGSVEIKLTRYKWKTYQGKYS